MNHSSSSRRDFLQKGATLAAGTLLGSVGWDGVSGSGSRAIAAEHGGAGSTQRKRVLRIAHLTDVHVQPERRRRSRAHRVSAPCAAVRREAGHHLQRRRCGHGFAGRRRRSRGAIVETLERDASSRVFSARGELHRQSRCLWLEQKKKRRDRRRTEIWQSVGAGSARVARPYRSFDRAGWHFVVLDSIYNSGHDSQEPGQHDVYEARLDDEQFAWLAEDLKNNDPNLPVCVLSHIPILSACAYFDGRNEKTGEWRVPASFMHIDARRIKNLFLEHPNIRLCLSGHIHLLDRVDYDGVSYLCNGAVSGNWWKGKYQECDAGYALVDLFDDGSFEQRYLEYGWKAARRR